MTTKPATLATIRDVRIIKLPMHRDPNGDLVVLEGLRHVPFLVARVFFVRAAAGSVRGQHAHKACAQLFNCPNGSVDVVCDDGVATSAFRLNEADVSLLVPSGIWSQQTYLTESSILAVLCDQQYEADDYIRDYDDFKAYRRAGLAAE